MGKWINSDAIRGAELVMQLNSLYDKRERLKKGGG